MHYFYQKNNIGKLHCGGRLYINPKNYTGQFYYSNLKLYGIFILNSFYTLKIFT